MNVGYSIITLTGPNITVDVGYGIITLVQLNKLRMHLTLTGPNMKVKVGYESFGWAKQASECKTDYQSLIEQI